MRPFSSSIALRLTVWFLILSVLPLAVMAIFVRRNVLSSFEQAAVYSQQEQARANAIYLNGLITQHGELDAETLFAQPVLGKHFVVDGDGIVLFHPVSTWVGVSLYDIYGEDTAGIILGSDIGGVIDDDAGQVIGFSRFPANDWVDIVVADASPFQVVTNQLLGISSLQLAISLAITFLVGGLVIRFVVGNPLMQLTRAAQELGHGNLDVELDASEMEDELGILAATINEARLRIRNLVGGLEHQVKELAHASSSLRDSEARFRTIFDSITDAILIQDFSSGSILEVNGKFCEMFGYQPEDVSLLSMKDLTAGTRDYDYRSMRRMVRMVKKNGPQIFEWYVRRKNGTFFWVEISMHLASLDDGQQHVVVVVRDIDQRKRNQQIQVAIYRVGQVAQAKPTLYEFFSSLHQILQTLMPSPNFLVALYRDAKHEIYYPYHLDEHEIWPSAQQHVDYFLLKKMRESSGALWITAENFDQYLGDYQDGDFDVPFQEWLGVPLQTAHGSQGALVMKYYGSSPRPTSADVEMLSLFSVQVASALERNLADDALRESEARWRTLMQSAPQLIVTVNRSGKIVFVNQPLSDFPGGGEPDTDMEFFRFLPGETLQDKKNVLDQVFSKRMPAAFEFMIVDAKQRKTWFSANLAPVVDRGRVDLAILNAMDITLRKAAEDQVWLLNEKLERRVKERTSMLEAANSELESFSYSISHDLRAPLRAINGFSRILEDEIESGNLDELRRYLSLIRENAQQMGVLIDDLLSFSRLGRQAINLITVPSRELVSQVLYMLDSETHGRDVEFDLAELPDCIGDPVLIKQVWMNLLSNALKFTRLREKTCIKVDFEYRQGEIVYIVRDNGTGFDMKYADKLFGVFQRLHRADEFEGTGVGLAIVHRIVTRHGGRVWAESVPDQGSTFFFALPLKNENLIKK
ncbi:MAG: hypothetical protein CVU44_03960 [Chloroflexi bacterium HGW-Chloroflexi-6]|nr:MAG: hypothetical protein CVU44_03960 [Chloroflexi bacterium HGW-Chloroflexi-6]